MRRARPAAGRRLAGLGLGVAISLLAVAGGGCSGGTSTSETTLARVRREGVVRVGFANEAPYAYVDPKTDRLTGESPEIARAVLKDMGIRSIKGVLTEFGSLIPGLKAGRFDMIAAGMYVRPNRCKEIAFSEPTYSIGEAFMVRRGNPRALHGYQDVTKNPDTRLGVVAGAVEGTYARELGVPSRQIVTFPDGPSAVAGVVAGRIDAYAGTELTVRDLLRKSDSDVLEQAQPFREPVLHGHVVRGYGAFGFRKQDVAFRKAFNRHLRAFIGTRRHLALVKPFGFTRADLPGDVTTSELCARQP